jgi:hypothetical protein
VERQAPYTLSQTERADLPARIQAVLKHHQGAQNAITAIRIARLLGYHDDRKVRLAIQALITSGHAIAANVSKRPLGYYLVQTPEEAKAYSRTLRSRAVQTFKRMRAFELAAQRVFAIPPEPFQPALFEMKETPAQIRS